MSLPSGQWMDMPCGAVLPYICEEKLYGGSTLVSQASVAAIPHTLCTVYVPHSKSVVKARLSRCDKCNR